MKIFAIGMNYAAHNQELHGTLKRPDEPVIFTKADSAILNQGKPFFIPDHLGRIDYETEVVVRICRLGKNISQRLPTAITMPLPSVLILRLATFREKPLQLASPGRYAKDLTDQQLSESGYRKRSSSIFSVFISIWTSTAKPYKKVVHQTCSIR